VAGDAWYAEAISWASANGIVQGYGAGLFAPNQPVLRQEFAAIIGRYVAYAGETLPAQRATIAFADAADVEPYALDSLNALYAAGILNGIGGGYIQPLAQATRAEAAALFHRLIEALAL